MIKGQRQKQRRIIPRHTYLTCFYVTYTYDILNAIYLIKKHIVSDDIYIVKNLYEKSNIMNNKN